MQLMENEAAIEALLFTSGEAVSLSRIAEAIGLDIPAARLLLTSLNDKYISENRGIRIVDFEDKFQMATNPEMFCYVEKLIKSRPKKILSQTLLETLAIVAYKQPVTKAMVEEIRGVNADHSINRLMEFGLIEERGRQNAPGRPILFGTSDEFLKYFGLQSFESLPNLPVEIELLRKQAEQEIDNSII